MKWAHKLVPSLAGSAIANSTAPMTFGRRGLHRQRSQPEFVPLLRQSASNRPTGRPNIGRPLSISGADHVSTSGSGYRLRSHHAIPAHYLPAGYGVGPVRPAGVTEVPKSCSSKLINYFLFVSSLVPCGWWHLSVAYCTLVRPLVQV